METENAHPNGELKREMETQPVENIKTEQDDSLSFQPQQLDLKQESQEAPAQHVRNELNCDIK